MSGKHSWEPPYTHNPTNRHTREALAALLQITSSYGRAWLLAQEMWVETGEPLGWNVQKDKEPWDARAKRTAEILCSNKLAPSVLTRADFGRKNRGSGEGGGRPQETKHEAGECKVYSVGSEWVEVVEQKVLEGEKSLVVCNAGVLEKDLKVFNYFSWSICHLQC